MTWLDSPDTRTSAHPALPGHLSADLVIDYLCPWCWIGLRNLREAIALLQAEPAQAAHAAPLQPLQPLQVELNIVPHQLLPQVPTEGLDYTAFYLARLGSAENIAARRAQVRAAGAAAGGGGIVFQHEAIQRLPNTLSAHRLTAAAKPLHSEAAHLAWVEAVFAAYFQRGLDIGDTAVLAQLAAEQQLPEAALQAWRTPDHRLNPRPLAVNGVPHAVVNGWQSVSGAQPVALWLRALQAVLDEARQP